jgi:ADP-ribose pyrophosphatase YjhB (NUDIX family)
MATIGVFASIFDSTGCILLVRHVYGTRTWSTPGGRVEAGESPVVALEREVREEIASETRIAHLIGVYAKPYRDDVVLSFAVNVISGVPRPCLPEISDVGYFSRDSLPTQLAFNSRVRIEDAFDQLRGVVRVFDTAESLEASLDAHARSHAKA